MGTSNAKAEFNVSSPRRGASAVYTWLRQPHLPVGVRLAEDAVYWSHMHLGYWLERELALSWHRKVVERLEIDGPAMLELISTGQMEGLFEQAAGRQSFEREKALGRQSIAFNPPAPGTDLPAAARAIRDGLAAVQEAAVHRGLDANQCGVEASEAVLSQVEGLLWGAFVGDALGMPTQWYYSAPRDIIEDFGAAGITGFEAPRKRHPTNTVMSDFWKNNREHCNEVIGSIICHGKAEVWEEPYRHYHDGLLAGENTCNLQLVRVLMRRLARDGGRYDCDRWLEDYVEFMTTQGSHNDTFVETYHVQFFYNHKVLGRAPRESAGEENHSTAAIGPVSALPSVLFARVFADDGAPQGGIDEAIRHLELTHRSPRLAANCRLLMCVLLRLARGDDLRGAIDEAGMVLGIDFAAILATEASDMEVVAQFFGLSCYIHMTLPVVLYLAYKYQERAEPALLSNASCGGNTDARGCVLGMVLGAAYGKECFPARLRDGLVAREQIADDIAAYLSVLQDDA